MKFLSVMEKAVSAENELDDVGSWRIHTREEWLGLSREDRDTEFFGHNILVTASENDRPMPSVKGWDERAISQYISLDLDRQVQGKEVSPVLWPVSDKSAKRSRCGSDQPGKFHAQGPIAQNN